jgi:hypothetical protein
MMMKLTSSSSLRSIISHRTRRNLLRVAVGRGRGNGSNQGRFSTTTTIDQNVDTRRSTESPTNTPGRAFSSTSFSDEQLLDDKGLLRFKTLHELQEAACQVYSNNELFGTYSPTTQQFEYMTYNEFGHKVAQCRAVLIDLGTKMICLLLLYLFGLMIDSVVYPAFYHMLSFVSLLFPFQPPFHYIPCICNILLARGSDEMNRCQSIRSCSIDQQ